MIIDRQIRRMRNLLHDFGQFRAVRSRQRGREARLIARLDTLLAELSAVPPRPRDDNQLILGLAAGYGESELAPFVLSLRESGYRGDTVLFTCDLSPAATRFLAAHGIAHQAFESLPLLPMGYCGARNFRYLEFLRGAASEYGRIMLTDVRDVVFQNDPFAHVGLADLYYFLESDSTIGGCPVNSEWMCKAFGASSLAAAAESPVSCAGTVAGSPAGMLRYLVLMCRFTLQAAPGFRYTGIDQAIHNHLMIHGLVPNAAIVENGRAVCTVPEDDLRGIHATPDGLIRNADGTASDIVHQYDRHPALVEAVARRYVAAARPLAYANPRF